MRWSLPLLMACSAAPIEAWQQISPLDGGTGIAAGSPLTILADDDSFTLPQSWLAPLVHLTDLSNGSDVPGEVEVSPGQLRFLPDIPLSGHYAWTIDAISDAPHGPHSGLREGITGTASFETALSPRILAAGVSVDRKELCFVLSQRVEDLADWSVDADVDAVLLSEDDLWPDDRPELLDPVSVVCIPETTREFVRASWAERSFQWTPADDTELIDVLLSLRSLQ